MAKAQGIKVKVLRYHTFNGTAYNEGDTYEVVGDSHQTADQYLETLKANRLASDDDSGPLVVNEIGAEPQQPAQAADKDAQPAAAPDATAEQADEPVDTPKPKKQTRKPATHRKVTAPTHKK